MSHFSKVGLRADGKETLLSYVFRDHRMKAKPWCIAYRGVDGKLHKEKTDAPTKELAKKLLAKRLVEVTEAKVAGVTVERKLLTFSEFLPQYLSHIEARKTPGSIGRDLRSIKHLRPVFGGLRLRDITVGMIQSYVDTRMHERRKSGKSYRPATINREMACLSAIFREAVKRGFVEKHPVRGIRPLPEDNAIVRYLVDDEEERLLAAVCPTLRPVVLCALHTGMRRDEILSLTWEDVDLDQCLIRVRHTKSKRTRYIPVNDVLRATLEDLARFEGCPYVFANPLTRNRWLDQNTAWYSAIRRSGLKNFRFHDLRHTFASRLMQAGAPMRAVQELLGHGSILVTMRYAHLAPGDLRRAVDLLVQKPNSGSEHKSPKDE